MFLLRQQQYTGIIGNHGNESCDGPDGEYDMRYYSVAALFVYIYIIF